MLFVACSQKPYGSENPTEKPAQDKIESNDLSDVPMVNWSREQWGEFKSLLKECNNEIDPQGELSVRYERVLTSAIVNEAIAPFRSALEDQIAVAEQEAEDRGKTTLEGDPKIDANITREFG